jgi:branched-chain amino acid transport system ATP-binding protein
VSFFELQRVSKRFGGLMAVDFMSFEVRQGEIFGLIGSNGAGKITIFNLII